MNYFISIILLRWKIKVSKEILSNYNKIKKLILNVVIGSGITEKPLNFKKSDGLVVGSAICKITKSIKKDKTNKCY